MVLTVTDGLPTKNKAGNTIEDGATDPTTVQLREQYIQEVVDEVSDAQTFCQYIIDSHSVT